MNPILRPLALLAILFAAYPVFGDGIPVTPGRKDVTEESFTIQLDEAQVQQVERLRTITLTEAQLAPLLAIYDKTPATFEVVSSRYDSCTCSMEVYGIWCRPGEIKVPKYCIEYKQMLDEYRAQHPVEEEESVDTPDPNRFDGRAYILDSAGKIYASGKEVQESDILATVEELYERRKANPNLRCSLGFDTPPPLDEATDTVIKELAGRIKAQCDQRFIGFWASGLDLNDGPTE